MYGLIGVDQVMRLAYGLVMKQTLRKDKVKGNAWKESSLVGKVAFALSLLALIMASIALFGLAIRAPGWFRDPPLLAALLGAPVALLLGVIGLKENHKKKTLARRSVSVAIAVICLIVVLLFY